MIRDLAIIAAYFNPNDDSRRARNLHLFLDSLKDQMLPVWVVELAFEGSADGADPSKEIQPLFVMPARGNTLRFVTTLNNAFNHRERLLNRLIPTLPPHIRKVAWVDADITFDPMLPWYDHASDLLEDYQLIQLYAQVRQFDRSRPVQEGLIRSLQKRGVGGEGARSASSTSSRISSRPSSSASCETQGTRGTRGTGQGHATGVALANPSAWAARRDLLEHPLNNGTPLFDRAIAGGGDALFALGTVVPSVVDHPITRSLPPALRESWITWAEAFCITLEASVSYLPHTIVHHGSPHPPPGDNFALLRDFNPYADIAPDRNGVWRWSLNASPELRTRIAARGAAAA